MQRRTQRRGLSLIETLFSLFFITTTVLMTAQLIMSASRLQREVEKSLTGAFMAERILAKVRADSIQSGVAPVASSGNDPQLVDFRYQIQVQSWSRFSPCSAVELAQLPANRRELADIGHEIKVTVSWSPYQNRHRASAYGVVLKPLPEIDQLVMTADASNSSPFSRDEVARFRVEARTDTNQPVPGIFFRWYMLPLTGNGSVRALTRDGREGEFTHLYNNPYLTSPVYFPSGSQCQVEARAIFNGKEFTCQSSPLDLNDL